MKTQIRKIIRVKALALLLLYWPFFALGAGTADSYAKAQIEALLVHARKALAQDQLTVPSDDNALGYAQEVLTLSPAHPEAKWILKEIVDRYGLIADVALDRAEALRARELEKARTYRSRGERVAKHYRLPDEKLRDISERIAALEKKSLAPTNEAAIIEDHFQGREVLKRIVARYLDKSRSALDLGSVTKARFYHDIAQELVRSYRLPEAGLEQLVRHIAEAERNYGLRQGRGAEQAKAVRDPTGPDKVQSVFLPPAF